MSATIAKYHIYNKRNGKFYIGSSVNVERRFDRHFRELRQGTHHCYPLQDDWNKFGEDAFEFQIIKICSTKEEAINSEQNGLDVHGDNLYNVSRHATCGDLVSYHPKRDEIVSKMKSSLQKRYNSMTEEERKAVYGSHVNGMQGRTHTDEAKKKMSNVNKGNSYAKGAKRTLDQRARLSEIASKRTGEKNPFHGKTHSEETKKKLSSKMKGKLPPNTKPVFINGMFYQSASMAARTLGVSTATVINRIKSPKFPTYQYNLET